jgi:hypothetical protein
LILAWRIAAVFQSLLYEAAGRTINPVSGAVGLLWAGSWHLCEAAVQAVLRGAAIHPLPELAGGVPEGGVGGSDLFASSARRAAVGCSTFSTAKRVAATTTSTRKLWAPAPEAAARQEEPSCDLGLFLTPGSPTVAAGARRAGTPSMSSDGSVTTTAGAAGGREPELLNLFV